MGFMIKMQNYLKEKFADPIVGLQRRKGPTKEKQWGDLNVLVWGPDLRIAPPTSEKWATKQKAPSLCIFQEQFDSDPIFTWIKQKNLVINPIE